MEITEEFISLKNGKYIISREFNGTTYNFGEFETLDLALEHRKKINDDGWPIKKDTPIINKSIKHYILDFIENKIIQRKNDVEENDPNINKLYKNFNIFIQNEDIHVPLKTFKYYFPRLINKNYIKREFINGSSRYNVTIIDDKNNLTFNKESSKTENNDEVYQLHEKKEVIPRLESFFDEYIQILNRNANIEDPTLNEICVKFNEFLSKYNENITLNSFKNFFAIVLKNHKKSNKEVIDNKTHYNISFISKKEQMFPIKKENISLKNDKKNIKSKIEISEVNNISIINIEGSTNFDDYNYLIDFTKKIKKEMISFSMHNSNNIINFKIKIIENSSQKKELMNKINKLIGK